MRHSLVSIVLVLSACGDSPHATPDAAVDAAPDVAAAPDAAGACRVVVDLGSVVMEMNVATATPAPLGGGPLSDGTYKLTALSVYTGPAGATGPTGTMGSETSYLAGGFSHLVTTANGTSAYTAYAVATNGTAVVIGETCPNPGPTTFDGYTRAGDVVTFYDSQNAFSREYTRIP
jgi:hypothetical protein